jgi:hypothetical protein
MIPLSLALVCAAVIVMAGACYWRAVEDGLVGAALMWAVVMGLGFAALAAIRLVPAW